MDARQNVLAGSVWAEVTDILGGTGHSERSFLAFVYLRSRKMVHLGLIEDEYGVVGIWLGSGRLWTG